jgi:UDP-N-acetylmuramyl pentapeptide synthase
LRALQDLAHGVRLAAETRVIAITGSAGKTTTKETIAEMLATRDRVVKNKGNLNNHIGLPLSLMQLRTRPDVAVMELGMNHAGEISRLVEIAEPDVRVWTNVGDAHLGFFASPDAIADAKGEILQRADRRDAAGLQCRRSARDGAGARVRGPDDHVRHGRERRRAGHVDRGPRRGRHARACDDAGWRALL